MPPSLLGDSKAARDPSTTSGGEPKSARDRLMLELACAAQRVIDLIRLGRRLDAKGEALTIRIGWRSRYPALSEVMYLALQTTLDDTGVQFKLPFLPRPAAVATSRRA